MLWHTWYWWFSTRLQYVQCISNGVTAVLHYTGKIRLKLMVAGKYFASISPDFCLDFYICINHFTSRRYLSILLSHPGLGWLYVFSSFPPRPSLRPRPPPQKLFPLTSKEFELNLWYMAQRIYGSGEMYWMTFPWPWPKVTTVGSISKNLLVCAIKWEPLIGSLQNAAALLP